MNNPLKNPLAVYALVGIVSFLVIFTGLYFAFRPKSPHPAKVLPAKTTAPAESTMTIGDSLKAQPDTLDMANDRTRLLKLKQDITDLYSGKTLKNGSSAQTEAALRRLSAQVDSIEKGRASYQNYIDYQKQRITTLQDSLKTARKNIALLEGSVASMKAQKQPGVPSIKAQTPVINPSKSLQEVANTYNSMKPERVADLLSTMPDAQAVEILKKMNEKKRGKVLEVMPISKASALVERLTQP